MSIRSALSTILPRYITATRSLMCLHDAEVVGDKQVGEPRGPRCRSFSMLRTCAWMETSRAEIGSSQTMKFRPEGQRAGDADALPLAAGELVRVAAGVIVFQAHLAHDLA